MVNDTWFIVAVHAIVQDRHNEGLLWRDFDWCGLYVKSQGSFDAEMGEMSRLDSSSWLLTIMKPLLNGYNPYKLL